MYNAFLRTVLLLLLLIGKTNVRKRLLTAEKKVFHPKTKALTYY